jgi:hypothetical protein
MIVLSIVLLIVGYVIGSGLLFNIGLLLLVIGAILWILGGTGHPVAGRRYWF